MIDFSKCPVIAEADVVVCGAGPGGMGAAFLAGKSGASVAVIESAGRPGGMAAVGEIMPFMSSALNNKAIDAPVYDLWVKAIYSYQSDRVKKRIDASSNILLQWEKVDMQTLQNYIVRKLIFFQSLKS